MPAADKIIDAFGDQTQTALEDARRLVTYAGLSQARATKIATAWRAHHADRDALVFLRGIGLGERMAARVRASFENESDYVRMLQDNPYRLMDVAGIGFVTADRAAQTVGIAADAPFRVRAGLIHALELRAREGHTVTTREVLVDLLGHSSIRTTLDLYSHVTPTLQRAAAEKMGNLGLTRARKNGSSKREAGGRTYSQTTACRRKTALNEEKTITDKRNGAKHDGAER